MEAITERSWEVVRQLMLMRSNLTKEHVLAAVQEMSPQVQAFVLQAGPQFTEGDRKLIAWTWSHYNIVRCLGFLDVRHCRVSQLFGVFVCLRLFMFGSQGQTMSHDRPEDVTALEARLLSEDEMKPTIRIAGTQQASKRRYTCYRDEADAVAAGGKQHTTAQVRNIIMLFGVLLSAFLLHSSCDATVAYSYAASTLMRCFVSGIVTCCPCLEGGRRTHAPIPPFRCRPRGRGLGTQQNDHGSHTQRDGAVRNMPCARIAHLRVHGHKRLFMRGAR